VFGSRVVTDPLHAGAYTAWWVSCLAAGLVLVEVGCWLNARFFVDLEGTRFQGAIEGTGLAALALGVGISGNSLVLFSLRDSTLTAAWLAVGLALCLAGLASQHRHVVRVCRSPEFPLVLIVTGGAVLGVAVLGLVSALSLRHHTRIHLAGGGRGGLTPRSKKIVERLDAPLRIISTLAQNPNPPTSREEFLNTVRDRAQVLLDEYESHSPRIEVIQVDLYSDPAARERFEQELDADLHVDTVVFDAAKGRRVVPLPALIARPPVEGQPEQFRGEEVFSTTLQAIIEGGTTVVGFVTGHGERLIDDFGERDGLSGLVALLEGDNCTVKNVVLPDVPKDCNVLVVAGPRRAFLDEELEALDSYLRDRRGGVIVLLDPLGGAGQASGLEPLLRRHGIVAATGLTIVQAARGLRGSVPRVQLVTMDHGPAEGGMHPVTTEMRGLRTAYDVACPIVPANRGRGGDPLIAELVRTPAETWAKPELDASDSTSLRPDATRDRRGPFPVAVGRGPWKDGQVGDGTRMVVFGDSDFVTNRLLRKSALGNATLFRNAVSWVAGKEYKVGIPPKPFGQVHRIENLTRSKKALTWWATVFAPPFHIVLLGLIVWWARRR
jgi:hypothetical protein